MSDLPTIVVVPRTKASHYLMSASQGPRVTCVISIGEPGEKLPAGYGRVPHRLRLEFADTERAGTEAIAVAATDMRRLISFASVIRAAAGTTLIYCEAGVSRSTAAAFITFATLLGPGQERAALEAMLAVAPAAQPNRLMVRLADAELQRAGRLVAALEERFGRVPSR